MPLPDACCDCTCKSFCNETAAVIRFSDGSYDPPKVPRVVQRPGTDGANVPAVEHDWLLYGPERVSSEINIGRPGVTSEACVWNLVSGAHSLASFELAPTWIPRPAVQSLLATVGLSVGNVQVPQPREAVNVVNAAIAAFTENERAQFWNDLIVAGFRDLWFNVAFRRDITLTAQGTVLTRTTANKPVQVVEMRIAGTARQPDDTSGTLFTFDPLTADVLIGCDSAGSNQQYTLRVRVEHGDDIEPVTYAPELTDPARYVIGYSSWGNADLQCHTMIAHSQTYSGQFQSGSPIAATEARVYLEVLNHLGQAIESVLVPAENFGAQSAGVGFPFFGGVGVRWSWATVGGQIHINANVSFVLSDSSGEAGTKDSEDASGEAGSFGNASVLRHLFLPQAADVPSRIGVSLPRTNRHSVKVRHRQFRRETTKTSSGLPLSPSIPADASPYCDSSHPEYQANQQTASWPWTKTNCVVWRRHGGRVTAGLPDFTECDLKITADQFYDGVLNTYRPATLLPGEYSLGQLSASGTQLVDNSFWFEDEPGTSYSIDVPPAVSFGFAGGTYAVRLLRLEFSMTVGSRLLLPCNGGWSVRGYLRGRAVFEQTSDTLSGVPYTHPPMSRFFKAVLVLPESFLRGEAVNVASSLPQLVGSVAPTMQWYQGGPSHPFNRIGGPDTTTGRSGLDLLLPVSELVVQLKT